MEQDGMMEKSKRETGGIAKFIEEAKDRRLNQIIEAMSEKIDELQAKAAAYDELKCTPNLPDEYNVFLVYLVRNRGDFHKTIRVLTDDGRCSLECVKWFAMMLGISWEPDWR